MMKYSTRMLCVAFLSSAAGVDAAEPRITFNGVPLGVAENTLTKIYPGFRCNSAHWSNPMADRVCVLRQAHDRSAVFAGMPATIYARFFEDRLASVTVSLDAPFENVVDPLFEAFGMPVGRDPVVVWRGGGVMLQAMGASDRTELIYRADWLLQEFAVRARAQEQRWAWLTEPNRVTAVIGKGSGR